MSHEATLQRYQRLLDAVTDARYSVVIEGGQSRATYHSPSFVNISGYRPEDFKSDPQLWYRMIYPEDQASVLDQISQLLAGQSVAPLQHRIIHKNGGVRWIQNTLVPEYDRQGQLVAYDGLVQDITVQKQLQLERERLLQTESEQRLFAETQAQALLSLATRIGSNAVLDKILDQVHCLVPYSAANIVLKKNDMLEVVRWKGYEQYGSEQFFAEFSHQLVDFPLDAEALNRRTPLLVADTTQDPRWVPLTELNWVRSFATIPIYLGDQPLGLLRLDGDRPGKFTTADLEKLKPFVHAAAVALGNAQLFEQLQQELAEKTKIEKELVHLAARNQAILRAIPDSMFFFDQAGNLLEYSLVDDPAHQLLADISQTMVDSPAADNSNIELADILSKIRQAIRQVFKPGTTQTFEFQLNSTRGVQFFETRFVRAGSQEVLGLFHDITTRKVTEQRALQTERLRALGQLAASIAHELSNPLQAIQANLDLVLDFPASDEERDEALETIREEIVRLSHLSHRVLSVSRSARATRHKIKVTDIIEQVLALTQKQLANHHIKITTSYQEIPPILGAPNELLQVFLNLVLNAIEAAPRTGAYLEITTKREKDEILVTFANRGPAIPPESLPYIFEPFFTTKDEGSGLGLWVSLNVIEQHGGSITVENLDQDQGVRFTIRLPAPS